MSYNGWSNYETWNVNLWIDNDEPMYRERQRWMRRRYKPIEADDVEMFVRDLMPDGTPDFDVVRDYAKVDWDEIASHWEEERLENDA